MSWHQATDAPPSIRITTLAPSLQPNQRKVAEVMLVDAPSIVELTAQGLADRVGVGRATVIRTAQSLGYDGFPQLRVALAQELALAQGASRSTVEGALSSSLLGHLQAGISDFQASLSTVASALTEDDLTRCIEGLDSARRVLVASHGLSAPLGLDFSQRLNSMGRSAEVHSDSMSEQIVARQLGEGSVCFAISGSGASKATLATIEAARAGGATIMAMTCFAHSAIDVAADVSLIVPPMTASFQDELTRTSRAALMLVSEQLIELLITHRGQAAAQARATSMSMIGTSLEE